MKKEKAVSQKKLLPRSIARVLLLLALAYLAVVVQSYVHFSAGIRLRHQELAVAEARSIFETTMAIRGWNASHGGVYVPVTERIRPNPYLDDPRRDLVATDGTLLTKVNPAYMTRLLGETISQRSGIAIRITSLDPIRPGNGPDDWEREALTAYGASGRPSWRVEELAGEKVFRYLDGMRVEKPCLTCHARQGYREGDARGGISVSFPYRRYEEASRADLGNLLLLHAIFLFLGWGLLLLVGWRLVAEARALESSMARVRTLEGLLPICSYCKRIRREGGDPYQARDWQAVETYVSSRTDAMFSHGVCPDCLEKHHPEAAEDRRP